MKIIPMRYLILLLLFPFLAFGQPCVNCPSSIKAPGFTPTSPVTGFNGYTSQVNKFDGVRPNCFTPTSNTLNGVIEGINNALCEANTRIDTLNILIEGDSIIQAYLDQIVLDLDSLYNTSLNSPDSSINISLSTNYNTNVQTWTLGVDIDTIKKQIMSELDFTCLGITTTNFDSAFQALINLACEGVAPSPDTCSPWDLFTTANITSSLSYLNGESYTDIYATSYSVGAIPPGMCLDQIEYIYQILDSNGVIMPNGYNSITYLTPKLDTAIRFISMVGYLDGARYVSFTTRFSKKLCSTGQFCGTFDTTNIYSIPLTTVPPFGLKNDTMTIVNSVSLNPVCATINVYLNDTIYGFAAGGIVYGSPNGSETFNSNTGLLQYCPDPLIGSNSRYDTLSYYVNNVFGLTDTALVIFHVINYSQIDGGITFSEFRNGASVDTLILDISMGTEGGRQFAQDGVLLEFDEYKTSVQLDDPIYINGNRDEINGTVVVLIDDVGATLDTAKFTLQVVNANYMFYEQPFAIPLSTSDTFNIYNTNSTTFQYAQPGTQFCVGSATDFVQTTLTIAGTGVLTANGNTYTNGVCIDSVVATAQIDTGMGYIPRDWRVSEVIVDAGILYRTTRINGSAVSQKATTSFGTTSIVKPNSTAYTTTITTSGFEFLDYNWYVKINHETTNWTYLKSDTNNPQCLPFTGIMNLTCND